MLAFFPDLDEMVLIIAMVLIVVATRFYRPERGLGQFIFEFRRALKDFLKGFDQGAFDAGKSVGGIYGKPAAEALTQDNRTAELYDPAVFRKREQADKNAANSIYKWFLKWSALLLLLAGFVAVIVLL